MTTNVKYHPASPTEPVTDDRWKAPFKTFPLAAPSVMQTYLREVGTPRASLVKKQVEQSINNANRLDGNRAEVANELKTSESDLSAASAKLSELNDRADRCLIKIDDLKHATSRFEQHLREAALERISLRQEIRHSQQTSSDYRQILQDERDAMETMGAVREELGNLDTRIGQLKQWLENAGGDPQSHKPALEKVKQEIVQVKVRRDALVRASQNSPTQRNLDNWRTEERTLATDITGYERSIRNSTTRSLALDSARNKLADKAKNAGLTGAFVYSKDLEENRTARREEISKRQDYRRALADREQRLHASKAEIGRLSDIVTRENQPLENCLVELEALQRQRDELARKVESPARQILQLCREIDRENEKYAPLYSGLKRGESRLLRIQQDLQDIDKKGPIGKLVQRVETIGFALERGRLSPAEGEQLGRDMAALQQTKRDLKVVQAQIAEEKKVQSRSLETREEKKVEIDSLRMTIRNIQLQLAEWHKEMNDDVARIMEKAQHNNSYKK